MTATFGGGTAAAFGRTSGGVDTQVLVTAGGEISMAAIAGFQAEVVEAQRLKAQGLLTDRTIISWYAGLTNPRN